MVLRPNCLLSFISDHVIMRRFEPVAVDRTRAVCEWLFLPATSAEGQYDVRAAVVLFARDNERGLRSCATVPAEHDSRAYRGGGLPLPSEAEVISRYDAWYRVLRASPPIAARRAASRRRLTRPADREREWHSSTGRS